MIHADELILGIEYYIYTRKPTITQQVEKCIYGETAKRDHAEGETLFVFNINMCLIYCRLTQQSIKNDSLIINEWTVQCLWIF